MPLPLEKQLDLKRREGERLRFPMPMVNPLTITLTAQILVAQGLVH